jgi:hypothetical protein
MRTSLRLQLPWYRCTAPLWLSLGVLLCLYAAASPRNASAQHPGHAHEGFAIPASVEAEHHELRAELAQLSRSGGKTGAAAQKLQTEMQPHFEKEEKYALPPLGLLGPLSEGKVTEEMRPAIALSDELKAQLPQMVIEHQAIKAAAQALKSAAQAENKPSGVSFADALLLHAQTEEQVLYPSAILVGEYLKLRLKRAAKP